MGAPAARRRRADPLRGGGGRRPPARGRRRAHRGLSRAAWHRGRHSRRFDAGKGTAPGLAGELRTLAGCVWHTGRYRCGNGIVLTAQTAGRLREALAGAAAPAGDADRDYLSGRSGTLGRRGTVRRPGRATRSPTASAARAAARCGAPPRRAAAPPRARRRRHAAGARAHGRALGDELGARAMPSSWRSAPAPGPASGPTCGATLAAHPPDGADWLLLVDDDVALPAGFLDGFLFAAEHFGLRLAQPAHAFASHAAWPVTRRRPGLIARRTRFVEIGPVTAIHADAFGALLPFPELEMGWGLDAHWSRARGGGRPAARDRRRHADPAPAPGRRRLPARRGGRRGRPFLAGRPYVTREQAAEVLSAWREL